MYSAKLLDYFEHPRNAGELPPPAITVEVTNPVCGDTLRLSVRVEEERISAARFLAQGCPAALAAASALAEWLEGQSLEAVKTFRADDVASLLDGLPPASRHAAVLCADALRALLRSVPPRV